MDLEERRRLRCPSCNSGYRVIVEGNKEGFFQCLRCGRRFIIPSKRGEVVPTMLDQVMP